ncbi:polysaccharide deacetylase family protein [Mesobacillus selenatarsenatis]|uniref:Polysaccharide deacetylase n=1 Tax=Mesobacillus selenatarsenatis (strain DSM 18680 / JCM 14380 / FERM P-15431 / SF-1) TaxID=1321606 RepID=A0A0A8X6F7_MESS1|nr:polysaccharide deacetylase family protein [Mesobacillus selenatarsenatis]GAM14627.1 polysaccharide deacetylase [Mesobacillus selenatarsenatis SF-1]
MKRTLLLAISASIILAGCGAAEEAQKPTGTSKEDTEQVQKEEKAAEEKPETEGTVTAEDSSEDVSQSEEVIQAAPQYEMKSDFSIQNIDNPDEQIVLLTIDDAPDKNALEMAKTLKDLNVKAIFFVNGHFLDTPEEGEVLKQIHQMGFPIGNHTYNHKSLRDLSEEQQRKEIVDLNDRVEELIGERPKFFRAPFGMNTDYSKQVAADEKMLLMNWTYGYDWEKDYQSKEALADIMVNTPLLRNGANLLMHDRQWTSAALGDIVKGLQNKGYKIVDPTQIETPANKETAAQ